MGRWLACLAAAALATGAAAAAADDVHPIAAAGVGVKVPTGWARVAAAGDTGSADRRTVLVVGTSGVAPRPSDCQVASYRIPAAGAAVVILGTRGPAPDGIPQDRSQLAAMRLRVPIFACWDGRGAVAQLALRGHGFQVNVLVGDRATKDTVADALAIARSFTAATS